MKMFHPIRLIVFCLAVYFLSVFFEAGRLISYEMTFEHLPMSVFSLIATGLCLFLIGYWVYEDEKIKNNIRVKFLPYEMIYKKFGMEKKN